MTTIKIKPLSVNEAWRGQRFKTPVYKSFEKECLWILPNLKLPIKRLSVNLVFGFSNPASDIDNPVKMILDILQKKYRFNDKDVYELNVKKVIVKKGEEYFSFEIKKLIEK